MVILVCRKSTFSKKNKTDLIKTPVEHFQTDCSNVNVYYMDNVHWMSKLGSSSGEQFEIK